LADEQTRYGRGTPGLFQYAVGSVFIGVAWWGSVFICGEAPL